jgi:predicted Zn-dependent peptidase
MDFEVSIGPNKLKIALGALDAVLKKSAISQSAIDQEIPILREEGALRDGPARLSELAWNKAFGDMGGDPFGNLDVMGGAKAAELEKLKARTFIAQNLALVIAGDVDLDLATDAAKDFFRWVPVGTEPVGRPRHASGPGSVQTELPGCAIAVPVPGYRNPRCAAVLAAALALSSDISDAFVTYTPSAQEGLVILGQKHSAELFSRVDAADANQMLPIARLFARRWVERQLVGSDSAAYWRGLLLIQERDLRPETLQENIEAMTAAQFAAALSEFSSGTAIRVVGR